MAVERARLIYNEKRYYDEDLVGIGQEIASKYNMRFYSYSIKRENNALLVKLVKSVNRMPMYQTVGIPLNELDKWLGSEDEDMGKKKKKNNNYSMKYALQYEGKGYLPEELIEIGNDLASIWGGSCNGYQINKEIQRIDFNCVEHGEEFSTDLAFYQLNSAEYSKYGTKLK